MNFYDCTHMLRPLTRPTPQQPHMLEKAAFVHHYAPI